MRRSKRVLAILALSVMVGCSNQLGPTTPPLVPEPVTLQLFSTSTTAPLINRLASSYGAERPYLSFETRISNHQAMMMRLAQGEIAYFISNHLPANRDLWAAPIAQDGLVIIVNSANNLSSLSTEQVRQIFQGYIRNWAELGGPDLPITVFSREAGAGTRAEFERLVMGQRRTSSNAQVVPSSEAAIISVADTPGGIAYSVLSQVNSLTQSLSIDQVMPTQASIADFSYPLRSTIFIIGQDEPEGELRAFLGWTQSFDGQAIVAESYVPLPS